MQNKHSFTWSIVFIVAIALLIRLINLSGSFWLDEAAQALESARPLSQQLDILPDFQPPLFHIVVHFFMQISRSEWWLRLASVIPALASIVLTIVIAKKFSNIHVAQIAGILLATSQFHTFYSQELRPYSMATMWALMSLWFLLGIINKKKKASIGFVISSAAGLYTMYLFPFWLITLWVYTLVWHKTYLKQITIYLLLSAIFFMPWLPTFYKQLTIGTGIAADVPAWSQIVSPPLVKMIPLTLIKFSIGRIDISANLVSILVISVAGILTLAFFERSLKTKSGKHILFLFAFPILLAFIVSFKVPVLDPKRVLFCLPLLYMVIASGVGKSLKAAVGLLALLSINMYALTTYATNPDAGREPWREAVKEVETFASQNDKIIFAFPEPFAPWRWYQTKNIPTIVIPNTSNNPNLRTELVTKLESATVVYAFDYLMDVTDPQRKIYSTLESLDYTETGFAQFSGIGKIRQFSQSEYFSYIP